LRGTVTVAALSDTTRVRFNLITDFVIELGETSSQLMRQLRRGRGRASLPTNPVEISLAFRSALVGRVSVSRLVGPIAPARTSEISSAGQDERKSHVDNSSHQVRRATPDEIPRLAEMLARAFHDDPVNRWMFPDDKRRHGASRRYFTIRVRQLIGQGEIYTTNGIAGAALWAKPTRWRLGLREHLQFAPLIPALGPRVPRSLRGLSLVQHHHPDDPHYFLSILGTDPAHQNDGIGSALMALVLQSCDANGIPAYLENSNERNTAFYSQHGFRLTGELRLPNGPPLWLMWRDPQ
jgi:ribosomal protein S18 acetylase RimI-like enzyme